YFPWRGYWWPFKGQSLAGPLSRYDQFVAARTGSNPGSRAWEASHHYSTGIWWQGHCNGWAASALLRAHPSTAKRDRVSGVVFSVSDQKGILAEKDFCAAVAFFGHRENGLPTDDPYDIHPALFHQTLTYYIGQLHKPVAMDYHADPVIDNH